MSRITFIASIPAISEGETKFRAEKCVDLDETFQGVRAFPGAINVSGGDAPALADQYFGVKNFVVYQFKFYCSLFISFILCFHVQYRF